MKPAALLRALVCTLPLLAAAAEVNAEYTTYYDRPIPMGVSISTSPSTPFLFAGTAGMLVSPPGLPAIRFILSNNHVIGAGPPRLCPDTAPRWARVVQPGTLDIGADPYGDSHFVVGYLFRTVPIEFGIDGNNVVDAAIAFTTPSLAREKIKGIGEPTPGVGYATPGMSVMKSGRTTGVTFDQIESVNATVFVSYGSCGIARFSQQAVTAGALGAAGDSGSVVLDSQSRVPVGLYFAGSSSSGILNQIVNVYDRLGVIVSSAADSAGAAPPARSAELLRLEEIQARHQEKILKVRGVAGIGIGRDGDGGRLGFVVYAESMSDELRRAVPAALDGVRVRLRESGGFRAY